jgi:PilZ domain
MDTGTHDWKFRMRRERRRSFRVEWNSPATVHDAQRHLDRPCILSNFSNGGAEITGVRAATIPDEFMLQITSNDIRKCRVVWRTDDTLGVEFTLTDADAANPGQRYQEPVG